MSKKNILLNNDGLYDEYRNGYEDSIDFFNGSKIEVNENKEKKVEGNEDKESIEFEQGLESLVLNFSKPRPTSLDALLKETNENKSSDVTGAEAIIIDTDPLGNGLITLHNQIYNNILKNVSRLNKKVTSIEKKRKKGTIRTKPIKMKSIVRKLGTAKTVSSDPNWILKATGDTIMFYSKYVNCVADLKNFLRNVPISKEGYTKLKLDMLSALGKETTGGSSVKNHFVSDPLPGNKRYIIRLSDSLFSDKISTYFTDIKPPVNVVSETCIPTADLIDKCIAALKNYLYAIVKSQKVLFDTLQTIVIEHRKAKSQKGTYKIVSRLIYITDLYKRMTNTVFKYVASVTDALYDFVNQGIK